VSILPVVTFCGGDCLFISPFRPFPSFNSFTGLFVRCSATIVHSTLCHLPPHFFPHICVSYHTRYRSTFHLISVPYIRHSRRSRCCSVMFHSPTVIRLNVLHSILLSTTIHSSIRYRQFEKNLLYDYTNSFPTRSIPVPHFCDTFPFTVYSIPLLFIRYRFVRCLSPFHYCCYCLFPFVDSTAIHGIRSCCSTVLRCCPICWPFTYSPPPVIRCSRCHTGADVFTACWLITEHWYYRPYIPVLLTIRGVRLPPPRSTQGADGFVHSLQTYTPTFTFVILTGVLFHVGPRHSVRWQFVPLFCLRTRLISVGRFTFDIHFVRWRAVRDFLFTTGLPSFFVTVRFPTGDSSLFTLFICLGLFDSGGVRRHFDTWTLFGNFDSLRCYVYTGLLLFRHFPTNSLFCSTLFIRYSLLFLPRPWFHTPPFHSIVCYYRTKTRYILLYWRCISDTFVPIVLFVCSGYLTYERVTLHLDVDPSDLVRYSFVAFHLLLFPVVPDHTWPPLPDQVVYVRSAYGTTIRLSIVPVDTYRFHLFVLIWLFHGVLLLTLPTVIFRTTRSRVLRFC